MKRRTLVDGMIATGDLMELVPGGGGERSAVLPVGGHVSKKERGAPAITMCPSTTRGLRLDAIRTAPPRSAPRCLRD